MAKVVPITLAMHKETGEKALVKSPEQFLADTETSYDEWEWEHGRIPYDEAMEMPMMREGIRLGHLIVVEEDDG